MSSPARALVDNAAPSRSRGGRPARTLSADEYEQWAVRLMHEHGPERFAAIRARAREIAAEFGTTDAFALADRIVGVVLGTRLDKPHTPLGRAAAQGRAWDTRRVPLLDALARALARHRETRPVVDPGRTASLPMFEAYFSNFIEGTEFTVDEALDIVRRNTIPSNRPRDAHDVLGTHQVVSDPDDMSRVPHDGDSFLDLLRERHRAVMHARSDMRPGQFKETRNQAGSTVFVDPGLVEGTLRHAVEYRDGLDTAFGRAAFMLFAVSEVHPFDDGNGRVARIMMNAELHAAGEHRIVIPTVYRDEHLDGLRRLSRHDDPALLVDVLDYAWRWTAQMDWSDDETAVDWLVLTEALYDAHDRDADSRRLRLPSEVVLPDRGFGPGAGPSARTGLR